LNQQLDNANGELRTLREDVGMLRCHSDIASQEIEDLRDEIERMRSTEDEADSERHRKRQKKGKRLVHSSDNEDEELDEDATRVRIFFNFKLCFSFAKLIFI